MLLDLELDDLVVGLHPLLVDFPFRFEVIVVLLHVLLPVLPVLIPELLYGVFEFVDLLGVIAFRLSRHDWNRSYDMSQVIF